MRVCVCVCVFVRVCTCKLEIIDVGPTEACYAHFYVIDVAFITPYEIYCLVALLDAPKIYSLGFSTDLICMNSHAPAICIAFNVQ